MAERRKKKKRVPPALAVAGLIALGTVVGALIVEGTARVLWKAPWYEQLLAVQQAIQLYEYRENGWGLRDQDYLLTKPEGRKRILMFGDSFTYGMGVPDDTRIFPEIIERELNALELEFAPDGVEVLNAGLPATLTGDWVDIWRRVGPQFKPDLVVIVFFLRDGTETMFIPEFFMKIRKNVVARNEDSYYYGNFYTYRLVRDQLDRREIAKNYTQRFHDGYFGNERQTVEWERAKKNLKLLRDLAAEEGARTALVVFPVIVELNDNYPFRSICDLLEEYGGSIAVPVYNLLDAFMDRDASRLWISPWDQHPNPSGHRLVADALLPFVAEQLREAARTSPRGR